MTIKYTKEAVEAIAAIEEKILKKVIQIETYVYDLETREVGMITSINEENNEIAVTLVRKNTQVRYKIGKKQYRLAMEGEIVDAYFRRHLVQNDPTLQEMYNKGYVYILNLNAIGVVTDVMGENVFKISYFGKIGKVEPITESTNMTGYFPRTYALSTDLDDWRWATEEEIALFKKKAAETEYIIAPATLDLPA